MRMRKLWIGIAAAVVVAACDGATATTTQPATVSESVSNTNQVQVRATGFLFKPDVVSIEAGGSVTWLNDDKILHTVTAGTPEDPDRGFDRQLEGAGTTTSIRFDQPGDYPYFCSRHPHMQGVVRVSPGT